MIDELIFKIVFWLSLVSIIAIVVSKVPLLSKVRFLEAQPKETFAQKLKGKFKELKIAFNSSLILQKIISKVRILFLKGENILSQYLQALRAKSKKQKEVSKDKYWETLSQAKEEK